MNEEFNIVTMDSVRIDKEKLSEKIKENRELHTKEYNEAVEAYKVIVVNKLKERMVERIKSYEEEMKSLNENLEAFEKDWETKPLVHVVKPTNHLDDYDTAIGMLDFSLDVVVHLDRQEFQSYVMDNWTWKKDFKASNNMMISGSAFYTNSGK